MKVPINETLHMLTNPSYRLKQRIVNNLFDSIHFKHTTVSALRTLELPLLDEVIEQELRIFQYVPHPRLRLLVKPEGYGYMTSRVVLEIKEILYHTLNMLFHIPEGYTYRHISPHLSTYLLLAVLYKATYESIGILNEYKALNHELLRDWVYGQSNFHENPIYNPPELEGFKTIDQLKVMLWSMKLSPSFISLKEFMTLLSPVMNLYNLLRLTMLTPTRLRQELFLSCRTDTLPYTPNYKDGEGVVVFTDEPCDTLPQNDVPTTLAEPADLYLKRAFKDTGRRLFNRMIENIEPYGDIELIGKLSGGVRSLSVAKLAWDCIKVGTPFTMDEPTFKALFTHTQPIEYRHPKYPDQPVIIFNTPSPIAAILESHPHVLLFGDMTIISPHGTIPHEVAQELDYFERGGGYRLDLWSMFIHGKGKYHSEIEYESIPCSALVGKTIRRITPLEPGCDFVQMEFDDCVVRFEECVDSYADVSLDDVVGDYLDLIGYPLLLAEESSQSNPDMDNSYTWTFYKFATIKGYVDLKWFGSSNGYYSEEVDIVKYTRK